MKGIVRIGGLEYMEKFTYVYWSLYVVKEMIKRIKKEIGSTAIKHHPIFFKSKRNRYRIDYLIITCTSSSWEKLKENLRGRYLCVNRTFKFKKRRQSWVKTDVDFWTTEELKNELDDFPNIMTANYGDFEIRLDNDYECPFYKPYTKFTVDTEKVYEKSLTVGKLILQAERRWKRESEVLKWKRRKLWKTENGNYKEC